VGRPRRRRPGGRIQTFVKPSATCPTRTGRLPAHRAALRLRRQRQERRLGIAILERIDSSDPTALTGLPLIALTGMLRKTGVSFFNI
jgi:hypothetical protein